MAGMPVAPNAAIAADGTAAVSLKFGIAGIPGSTAGPLLLGIAGLPSVFSNGGGCPLLLALRCMLDA